MLTPEGWLDAAILCWLVFTWFYEGHHRARRPKTGGTP